MRKIVVAYAFIAPLVIVITAVIAVPLISVVQMSFRDWYMVRPTDHPFIGFENYYRVIKDRYFIKALGTTGIYLVVTIFFKFILGLGVALFLNQKFRGRGLIRSIVIIPWALPIVVACLLWINMLDERWGIVNCVLRNIGLIKEPIKFFSDPSIALRSAIAVNIWKGTPFVIIMFLAGLQSIPGEIYEAAKIDGASYWSICKSIIIPMLKSFLTVVTLLVAIWTLKDFAIVYVLTSGGPAHATEVLPIYIYNSAFKDLSMGVGAAASCFLLLFALIFSILYVKSLGREEKIW